MLTPQIFKETNREIRKIKKINVVGTSGPGKSTLA